MAWVHRVVAIPTEGGVYMSNVNKITKDLTTFVSVTPEPSKAIESIRQTLSRISEYFDPRAAAGAVVFQLLHEDEAAKLSGAIGKLCKALKAFANLPEDQKKIAIDQMISAIKIECIIRTDRARSGGAAL